MEQTIRLELFGTDDQVTGARIGHRLGAKKIGMLLDGSTHPVTEMPTRKSFESAVWLIRNKLHLDFGIIFIDLDHFKEVNDSLGHAAGDNLLRVFSDILRRGFFSRESDALCHWGGDEFVIFVSARNEKESLREEELLQSRIEVVRSELIELCRCAGYGVDISYGIAYGEVCADLHTVIEEADQNMYKMKRGRKGIKSALTVLLSTLRRLFFQVR